MKSSLSFFLDQIHSLPNLYGYAAPILLVCILVEYFLLYKSDKIHFSDKRELTQSVLIGFGYIVISLLTGFLSMYILYLISFYLCPDWLKHPFDFQYQWFASGLSFVVCFVFYDLCRYWAHRLAHEKRFWWATHEIHHSASDYNLLVALRLSWVDQLKAVFFIPLLLLGFHPFTVYLVHQLSNILQFLQHTGLDIKFPSWLEKIIVSPKLHKVHHAKNEKYIDKNYSSIFIIWDKIFHTYQDYTEKPVFGLKKDIQPKNLLHLIFYEYTEIYHDILQQKSIRKKWRILWERPK